MTLWSSTATPLAGSNNDVGPAPEYSGLEPYFEYTFTMAGTYYLAVSAVTNGGYDPITGDNDAAGSSGPYILSVTSIGGPIPGDFNGDGKVDLDDFVILKQNFMMPGTLAQGDADGNGMIDLDDFVILKQNFLAAVAAAPPVAVTVDMIAAETTADGRLTRARARQHRRRSRVQPGELAAPAVDLLALSSVCPLLRV